MSGEFDQRSEAEGVYWGVDGHWCIFLFFFYFKGILVLLMPTVTVASNLIFPPPKSVGSLGVCFFSFFLASL